MVATANLPAAYAYASAEDSLELSLGRQDCLSHAFLQTAKEDSLEMALSKQDMRCLLRRADTDADAGGLAAAYLEAATEDSLEVSLAVEDARSLQSRADGERAEAEADIGLAAALMRAAEEDEVELSLAKKDLQDLQRRADSLEAASVAVGTCALRLRPEAPAALNDDLVAAYALAAEVDVMESSLAKRDLRELQRRADAAEVIPLTKPSADADLAAAYACLASEDVLEFALAKRDMRELQHHVDGAEALRTCPQAVTKQPATLEDIADAYACIAAADALETALAKQDLRSVQLRADAAETEASSSCALRRAADVDLAAAYAREAAEDTLEANLAVSDMKDIQVRVDASDGLMPAAADVGQEAMEAEVSDNSGEELNFSPSKKRRVGDEWQRQVSDASTSAPDGWERQVSESSTLAPGSPAQVC